MLPGTNSETGPCATSRAMNRCQEYPPPRSPSSQKLRCRAPRMSRGPIVYAIGGTQDQSPPNECSAFCMTVIGCSSTRRGAGGGGGGVAAGEVEYTLWC